MPAVSASRSWRARWPLAVGAGVAATTVALRFRDPHVPGSWGRCPFSALVGVDCPGCGALRAVNDLTRLDVVGAVSSNAVLVALVPVLVVAWGAWLRRRWRGVPARTVVDARPALVGIGVGAVVLVSFAVFRNVPAGAWFHS